jgi:putative DNA primase/helicase
VKSEKRSQSTLSRKKQALSYARRGWRVLPLYTIKHGKCTCGKGAACTHPGKHPQTPNGVKDATTDRDRIKGWTWPDANIGVATGNGLSVLDVDGEVGQKNLKVLEAKYRPLPVTVTVETGKGRHYYFKCDVDVHIGNSVGRLGDGIDVRGDGGYVVGAGSRHNSGHIYRFVDGRGLGQIEIAVAPKWLVPLVAAKPATNDQLELPAIPAEKLERAKAYAVAALRREVDRVGKAPKHQRNDTLNRAAFKLGQLVPYRILNSQTVAEELTKAARDIGLDESEIEPTIASGLNAGRQHPRRLPFLRSDQQTRTVEPPQKSDDVVTKQLAELGETDTDNAQRFANRFGTKVIYTPGHGWLVFDGKR